MRRPQLFTTLVHAETILSQLGAAELRAQEEAERRPAKDGARPVWLHREKFGPPADPLVEAALSLLLAEKLIEQPLAIGNIPEPVYALTKGGKERVTADRSESFDLEAHKASLTAALDGAAPPAELSKIPSFEEWERIPSGEAFGGMTGMLSVQRLFSAGDLHRAEQSGAILRVAISRREVEDLVGENEEAVIILTARGVAPVKAPKAPASSGAEANAPEVKPAPPVE